MFAFFSFFLLLNRMLNLVRHFELTLTKDAFRRRKKPKRNNSEVLNAIGAYLHSKITTSTEKVEQTCVFFFFNLHLFYRHYYITAS